MPRNDDVAKFLTRKTAVDIQHEMTDSELIALIEDGVDRDDVPMFIEQLDLAYEDLELTEKIIKRLISSVRNELVDTVSEDRLADFDIYSTLMMKVLEDLE